MLLLALFPCFVSPMLSSYRRVHWDDAVGSCLVCLGVLCTFPFRCGDCRRRCRLCRMNRPWQWMEHFHAWILFDARIYHKYMHHFLRTASNMCVRAKYIVCRINLFWSKSMPPSLAALATVGSVRFLCRKIDFLLLHPICSEPARFSRPIEAAAVPAAVLCGFLILLCVLFTVSRLRFF